MTGSRFPQVILHALLFLLAVVLYFFGLGIGLAVNPCLGTLIWALSGSLLVLNVWWILKNRVGGPK